MSIQEKLARENFIRKNKVKERLGGISDSSLYRYWKIYKLIPPPRKIRGVNVWPENEVNEFCSTVIGGGRPNQASTIARFLDSGFH